MEEPMQIEQGEFGFLYGVGVVLQDLTNKKKFNNVKGKVERKTCEPGHLAVRIPDSPMRLIITPEQFKLDVASLDFPGVERIIKKWWKMDKREWSLKIAQTWIEQHADATKVTEMAHHIFDEEFEDYEGAKQLYLKALEMNPQHVDALNNLAVMYETRFEEFEEAIKYYELAVAAAPQNVTVLTNYAGLLEKEGPQRNIAQASEIYERCLLIEPKNVEIMNAFCDLLCKHLDSTDRAVDIVTTALQNDQMNTSLMVVLAGIYSKYLANYDRARELLEMSVAIDPNNQLAAEEMVALMEAHFPEEAPPPPQEPVQPQPPVPQMGQFNPDEFAELMAQHAEDDFDSDDDEEDEESS